jgi:asparagine synthase (glutamine-hydrolysing)
VTGFLAVVGPAPARDQRSVAAMCRALAPGGASTVWADPAGDAVLAVARRPRDDGHPGATLLVADDAVVVADASLYYLDDLRAAIRAAGVDAPEGGAAALVLAAWRAWGEGAPARLEGDFAFAIWDRRRRALVAARDFAGGRPLFHAAVSGGQLVATSRRALLAHAACQASLDVRALAEAACGFAPADGRTCWRDVHELRAGEALACRDERSRTWRHWEAPAFEREGGVPFREAAVELRAMLQRATRERMPVGGRSAVWMSGGWDSTAVFAAGRGALAGTTDGTELVPVSISYPEGDSGREDELIQAVLEWWRVEGNWIRSDDIAFMAGAETAAATRDEPFSHPYEGFHRALARTTAALGARVAFSGFGGDQLFYVSHSFFADLLRHGRLRTFAREWRAKGSPGLRHFWRFAVAPLVPDAVYRAASAVRGRPVLRELDRPVPAWIAPAFARRHGLAESGRRAVGRRAGEALGSFESRWIIDSPFFQRAHAATTRYARDAGVELRSPLFDRRIIEFASTRPRWERSTGGDTKLLLRAAMRDLLPPRVLAPRAARTGTSESYMRAATARAYPALVERLARDSRLADLGIVEPSAWRAAAASALSGRDDSAVFLYFTIQTELWLRGQDGFGAARLAGAGSAVGSAG